MTKNQNSMRAYLAAIKLCSRQVQAACTWSLHLELLHYDSAHMWVGAGPICLKRASSPSDHVEVLTLSISDGNLGLSG
jgi:hypothetical protein